jgi:YfiH family protein
MPDSTFLNINGQISAFSPRLFQNMSLLYGDTRESLTNRKNFLNTLGIDYRDLVCAKQIHSSCARYAAEEDRAKGALSYDSSIPDTDALVTDKRNLPLAVFTADCLSIFLYDSARPAVGLIHAGWRSTKENITVRAIQLMQERFNTQPSRLYVGFAPAIRSCCYEVGEDFNALFPYDTIRKNNSYYLDLVQINKKQVLDSGVRENNILDSGICTYCRNNEFFSYRKEGKTCGRLISVIMLK